MSSRRWPAFMILIGALAIAGALSACGSSDDSSSSTAAAADLSDCTPAKMDTVKSGTLTVATDSPAYPPYFADDDPTNGRGFESAVAYAVADKLGYSQDQVDWTVEPFNAS